MPFERIIHECDLAIENLKRDNPDDDVSMDVSFWECMKVALPQLLMTLSEGGVLSHPITANMASEVISRAMNHRTLGAPIRSIEEAPYDWFDESQDIEKAMAFLETFYGKEDNDGYLVQNRRCPAIFYDPHTKTYCDVEKADGYFNDLTGIGWTGRPFDPEFAKRTAPELFERLDMGRFNVDSKIHEFPYYPTAQHNSHPCTWEEECYWDFLDAISPSNQESEPMTDHSFVFDDRVMTGYLILIRFKGTTDSSTYLLYALPFYHYDEETDKVERFCIVHLMQYAFPYDMPTSATEIIYKSHKDFMAKYLPTFPGALCVYSSSCNLLEPDDNANPIFNFFVSVDNIYEDDEHHFVPGTTKHYERGAYIKTIGSSVPSEDRPIEDFYNALIFDIEKPSDLPRATIPDPVMEAVNTVYAMICRHDVKCAERQLELRSMRGCIGEKDEPTVCGC